MLFILNGLLLLSIFHVSTSQQEGGSPIVEDVVDGPCNPPYVEDANGKCVLGFDTSTTTTRRPN